MLHPVNREWGLLSCLYCYKAAICQTIVVIMFLLLVCVFLLYIAWTHFKYVKQVPHFNERRVFITGCGTGFGNKLAKRLDELGVHVYAGCVEKVYAKCLDEETSSRVKVFQFDVTNQKSVDEAFAVVKDDLNGKAIWAIVNNAAVPAALVPFDWTKIEDYEKVLDVNLFGIIRTTLAFLPLLKRGGEGRIVNASSMNGRLNIMSNAYGVSKCALEALSDGLSFELKHFNVTVHTLQPSIFKTNMSNPKRHGQLIEERWERLDQSTKEEYGANYVKNKVAYVKKLYLKNTSSDLSKVIAAYEHAILARYPQNRYVVGWDAKFAYLPLSWLPFSVRLVIMPLLQRLAGLNEPLPQCSRK